MSADEVPGGVGDVDDIDNPNYKPPPQKTIEEILQADKDDESLRRYKEALLGGAAAGTSVIVGS
jgi:Rho GDP-dissociation inhibitor